MNEREMKQQQIYNLVCNLSSSASDIGDWKVIKVYEARMSGAADPYNADELFAARQAVRDEINKLQGEIEALEAIEAAVSDNT